MRQRDIHFLEYQFCLLLVIFAIARIVFLWYNNPADDTIGVMDVLHVLRTGLLAHDLSLSVILLTVPWVFSLVALRYPHWPLRVILAPYYILMGFSVGLILTADCVMYEFWQFKISAVILSYAASPEGATNSVSQLFLFTRIGSGVLLMLLIIIPCILFTPTKMQGSKEQKIWARNLSIIWIILLSVSVFFTRTGDAYQYDRLLLNHASVNPIWNFAASYCHPQRPADRYEVFGEKELAQLMEGLYPEDTEDVADTLLNSTKPNVLIIFMESFGGKFVKELGGLPEVSPQLSRMIPEGVFWENYYSCSFRTDRGTTSTFSGFPSYPDVSLMKETCWHRMLPSFARNMEKAGYETSYLYAGAMTNMGKRTYLENMGFETLIDDKSFRPDELTGWGAQDEVSARKAFNLIVEKDTTKQWMMVWQTLSSHEPWDVPYNRLSDKKLNAFAYTDHCVGELIDSLRNQPQWKNLLVIVMPDHGFLYDQTFEDPEFWHSPMLWTGGAVKEPRRMTTLMNQSDLASTLLSQLGIAHKEYKWSRNVLSRNYVNPFVYCNYPAGLMLKDKTGTSIYDLSANTPIVESPDDRDVRVRKAQAILQSSYDALFSEQ